MDARTFAQWTFRAFLALFAIVAGYYLSPWLGAASFPLAVLFWLAVMIGVLYAGEALPWIDRIESVGGLLRAYAPPLTADEKERIRQRAEQRELLLRWQDDEETKKIAQEQKVRRFFDD